MTRIAIIQLNVCENKQTNIARACSFISEAAHAGADMAILPEMFCVSYKPSLFDGASESVPGGEACDALARAAEACGIAVIGGSVPERCDGKLYNTCPIFNNRGELQGKYRKAHMFDVSFPEFRFAESDTLTRGENLPYIIDAPVRTGVSICFDIRFPEWSRIMMDAGVDLIALPASFSRTTGPLHWELLLRARAVDNQCFVAGVSPAQSACAYGHSMLVAPDGTVVTDLGINEGSSVIELSQNALTNARHSIPIRTARRDDLCITK